MSLDTFQCEKLLTMFSGCKNKRSNTLPNKMQNQTKLIKLFSSAFVPSPWYFQSIWSDKATVMFWQFLKRSILILLSEVYAMDRLKDSTKQPLTPAEYRRLKP